MGHHRTSGRKDLITTKENFWNIRYQRFVGGECEKTYMFFHTANLRLRLKVCRVRKGMDINVKNPYIEDFSHRKPVWLKMHVLQVDIETINWAGVL